jgi:hypothetical protein
MKKMPLKKLTLCRETLQSLDRDQVKVVQGRGPTDPAAYVTTGPKDSNPNCCA